MRIYLADVQSRKYLIKEQDMNVFLVGEQTCKNGKDANWKGLFILESYYYLRNNKEFTRLIQSYGKLLLDSGAFTFMQECKNNVDWDAYIEEYANFINKYDIKLFFELDIDSIVGLKEVERLRTKLELLTGKKPIPVWHKNRGKDYFIEMCKNYPYVAIGGIVTKEIPTDKYERAFPWFIKTAHLYGCKIHGLGYTRLANLKKYHFDSVDSTAWLYGNRGGYLYKFKPSTGLIEKITSKEGCRLKSREAAFHNFNEWVKYQQWADKFL